MDYQIPLIVWQPKFQRLCAIVSTQLPCLGLCYERERLSNEQLCNAANPAQENSWPNLTYAVGHVYDLYPDWEVYVSSPVQCQSMMLRPPKQTPRCFPGSCAKYFSSYSGGQYFSCPGDVHLQIRRIPPSLSSKEYQ